MPTKPLDTRIDLYPLRFEPELSVFGTLSYDFRVETFTESFRAYHTMTKDDARRLVSHPCTAFNPDPAPI